LSRRHLKILPFLALAVVALACAAVALGASAGSGGSGMPPGPRISFLEVRFPNKETKKLTVKQLEEAFRFVSVDAGGRDLRRFRTPGLITAGLGNISWSASGEEVAFLAAPASTYDEEDEGQWQVFVAGADGSDPHAVPGTKGATQPVLSPDGSSVAFVRYREHSPKLNPKNPLPWLTQRYVSATTWIAPITGGKPRRLTPLGNGRFSSPSSFSPDGSLLAVTVDVANQTRAVDLLDVATGKPRRVEHEASEAAFSPDGSRIAFSSYRDHGSAPGFDGPVAMGELYVANADFSDARRITRTPEIDESAPTWAPGGERLAFLATAEAEDLLGLKARVVESNADGTCAKAVVKPKRRGKRPDVAIQPPTWVPGEGRAVGPISC
jgi:dipeptidyl aminopeptidase/acylaminoacyl peptidase